MLRGAEGYKNIDLLRKGVQRRKNRGGERLAGWRLFRHTKHYKDLQQLKEKYRSSMLSETDAGPLALMPDIR